jgi:hypothetical protein
MSALSRLGKACSGVEERRERRNQEDRRFHR